MRLFVRILALGYISGTTGRSQSPSLSQEMNLIEVVADAQGSPVKSTARDGPDTHRSSVGRQTMRDGTDTQRALNPKHAGKEKEGGVEALSPIRELVTEEDEAQEKKLSQYSMSVMRDSTKESVDDEMKVRDSGADVAE